MALFRFHRGGLEESLRTTQVVKNLDELKVLLRKNDWQFDAINIEPYPRPDSVDWRIGWYTHIVMLQMDGKWYPVGFLSENL